MEKMTKNRNYNIDFWKFFYAWAIVFFHFYARTNEHIIGGRFGVEYFLLVSGVFFFMAYERESETGGLTTTPYGYLKKRFWQFFPPAFVGFMMSVVVVRYVVSHPASLDNILGYLSSDIWEILLIKMNGLNKNGDFINGPAWTMSSMLIVQFLLWGCLYHFNRKFLDIFMPATLLIGFGYWRNIDIADHSLWIGFTTFGTLRAWLVICMSYYCLQLTKKMKRISLSKIGEILLTVVEAACHVFITGAILFKDSRNYQWCVILCAMIATAIALSGHSLFSRFCNRVVFLGFLGKLSLSIYLAHWAVFSWYKHLYDNPYVMYSHKYSFALAVMICALLHYFITKLLVKWCRAAMNKVKYSLTFV